MNEIKLLPCPICGEEALECKTKVICSKCTCTVYGRNIDIARKLWNTRKPMEWILTRLEEASFPASFGITELVVLKERAIAIAKEVGGLNE